MIPVTKPLFQYNKRKKLINKAVEQVLGSNNYILGPQVKKFEKEFAKFIGVKEAIGVANGTDAIEIALRSLNINKNDEVITVSHTAVGTVAAIEAIGAKPILVDIENDYFTMSADKLNEALSKKTKALVVVHLYGMPANLDNIIKFCKKNNIFLVEDCSQAHGAKYKNKKVGSIGEIGCFSCYPTKNLGGIGDAGIITTNKKLLSKKIKMIREYGWQNRTSHCFGRNSRIDELQAAILRVKLKFLDSDNAERIKIAEYYLKNIKNKNVFLPNIRKSTVSVFHLFVIKTNIRNKLIRDLKKNKIQHGIHYPVPIHKQPYYKNRIKTSESMKNTESIAKCILSLPIFPGLKIYELKLICKTINELK